MWHPADMGCNGILLTGGASTRMGRDKATLVVDGRTLALRTAVIRGAGIFQSNQNLLTNLPLAQAS